MKHLFPQSTKSLIVLLVFAFLTTTITAQKENVPDEPYVEPTEKEFKHALNMCPIAVVFGIYAVNYEYLFAPHQGMVLRYEYEVVPNTYTDANIEASGMAFVFNYRYHLKPNMSSAYVGAFSRYRIYSGDGTLETQDFSFDRKDVTLGGNVGKRWIWKSGFNINFMVGYGYSFDDRTADPSNATIESKIDEFEKEYDFLGSFLGEFSVGYAF